MNDLQLLKLRRYADAEASDPFAFARGLCHIRVGLCGPCVKSEMVWMFQDEREQWGSAVIGPDAGSDGGYDATHLSGSQWQNIQRL
jgi:hypothetical protein